MINRQERLEKLQAVLAQNQLDAVLIGPSPDMRYLTGLVTGPELRFKGLFVLQDGRQFYLTSSLYLEESKKLLGDDIPVYAWHDSEGFQSVLQRVAADFGLTGGRIGINDGISAIHMLEVEEALGAQGVKGDRLVSELRIIKSEQEIDYLQTAADIIDAVAVELADFIRPGLTEKDVADMIMESIIAKGAPGPAFPPIVASGPNSSMPHYNRNDRVILEKDIVLVDMGCKHENYYSDTTRTFFVGEPTEKERMVYETVLEANLAAEAYAKEGVVAEDVDQTARAVIEKAGWGEYFITRTGHGIGINVHEHPFIVGGNKEVLRNGMAFSIEPGIYLPGEFGVRIEDIVVIYEGQARILNKSPKELIVL